MESAKPLRGKKRKGGVQQRMEEANAELRQESAVCSLLMLMLAQGILSGTVVHKISQAAAKDIEQAREGAIFPDLEKMARLKQGRNLVRSVHDALSKASSLPMPLTLEIPFKDGYHPSSILLPHEYFASMFESFDNWSRTILPDASKLPAFWAVFDSHPAMTGHPVRRKANYRTHCIPISVHGDEVPVVGVGKIWCRSLLSFSWASIIANACGAQCEDVMFFIWAVFEKFCTPGTSRVLGTMQAFWQVLRWSFESLFTGVWPSSDWRGNRYDPASPEGQKAGKPLAGGYYGCLVQLCGDLDYFSKWMNLPVSTNHLKPCGLCKATFNGPLSWMDNRENSPWQATLLTPTNWSEHWQSTCALFALPGMNALCVGMDYMHNMFLGWLQYAYGSIFYLLTHECLSLEPLANLKTVWTFIKEIQRHDASRHGYRHRLDKLSMFTKQKGYPKLKGRAADIKGLDKALQLCWTQYMFPDNMQHAQIAAFLALNVEIAEILDTYSPKYGHMGVPAGPYEDMCTKVAQMAQLHLQLCEHYKDQEVSLFNMTSKTHFVIHSIQLSKHLHPSLAWCFKGENSMKLVQRLFKSCLAGNKHWAVGRVAALKQRHLLHLRGK